MAKMPRDDVRFAWLVRIGAIRPGRAQYVWFSPSTIGNILTQIEHCMRRETEVTEAGWPPGPITCDQTNWFATALLASDLAAGTREMFPLCCPVYHGDTMVAVLLLPRS